MQAPAKRPDTVFTGSRGPESHRFRQAGVAQPVEHRTLNPEGAGSKPPRPTIKKRINRWPGRVEVYRSQVLYPIGTSPSVRNPAQTNDGP